MTPEEHALTVELRHKDIADEESRERRAVRHARIFAFCGSWALVIVLVALGWAAWDFAWTSMEGTR